MSLCLTVTPKVYLDVRIGGFVCVVVPLIDGGCADAARRFEGIPLGVRGIPGGRKGLGM